MIPHGAATGRSRPRPAGVGAPWKPRKSREAAAAYQDYLKVQPDDTAAQRLAYRLPIRSSMKSGGDGETQRRSTVSRSLKCALTFQLEKWDDAVLQAAVLAPQDAQLRGGPGAPHLRREFPRRKNCRRRSDDGKTSRTGKIDHDLLFGGELPRHSVTPRRGRREPPTPASCLSVHSATISCSRQAALQFTRIFWRPTRTAIRPGMAAQQRIIVLKNAREKDRPFPMLAAAFAAFFCFPLLARLRRALPTPLSSCRKNSTRKRTVYARPS